MTRLTDEELAEHIARAQGCASAELPGDTLRSLLAEVRERRAVTEARAPRKHQLERMRLELKLARKQVRSRAQHVSMLNCVLELERKELRELRALKAQVERVKACPRCGGTGAKTGVDLFNRTFVLCKCDKCGGLP